MEGRKGSRFLIWSRRCEEINTWMRANENAGGVGEVTDEGGKETGLYFGKRKRSRRRAKAKAKTNV